MDQIIREEKINEYSSNHIIAKVIIRIHLHLVGYEKSKEQIFITHMTQTKISVRNVRHPTYMLVPLKHL